MKGIPGLRTLGAIGGGTLPPRVRRVVKQLTGFDDAVTQTSGIAAVLESAHARVPYVDASRRLGLGDFPLALDDVADHEDARNRIDRLIGESRTAHLEGVQAAQDLLTERLAGQRGRVNIAPIVDEALVAWVTTWFGLQDGRRLLGVGRLIMHAVFLNPRYPKGKVDEGALDVAHRQVDAVRRQLTEELGAGRPAAPALAAAASVDDLLGLTVGPLALGSMTVIRAIHHLAYRERLHAVVDRDSGRRAFERAVGAEPPLPGVVRLLDQPIGRGRGSVTPGHVLVATACPMGPTRNAGLAFGGGRHVCAGQQQIGEVAGAILHAVAARRPRFPSLVMEGGAPEGVRSWPFPTQLVLTLT